MTVKRKIEVEQLVRWAIRDEISKERTSSAEGIWDRIREQGQNGGVAVDPGRREGAQRYPHFGLPHPDAYKVQKAISALRDTYIDWAVEAEKILGPMLAIADPRPLQARPTQAPRATSVGYNTRHIEKDGHWRREAASARDVIMVRTLRTAVLVTTHAAAGTRPDWCPEGARPHFVEAEFGPRNRPKLVGECRGRNLYTEGSHCPLQWLPSPIEIAEDRADYLAWWSGLAQLAASLELDAHEVLPPAAPEYPWLAPREQHQVLVVDDGASRMSPLPLKPQRDRAGPPRPRKRNEAVTMTERTA